MQSGCNTDVKTGARVQGSTLISPTWRYEAGSAQPTVDALIRLAKVLHVRLDDLVFGDERGPGEDLALQFEAVSQFTEHEK